jgi:hypothetical protein
MKRDKKEFIVDLVETGVLAAALGIILWWLVFYPI